MNQRSSDGPDRGAVEGDPLIEDAEIVEDASARDEIDLEPDFEVGAYESGGYEPGEFETGEYEPGEYEVGGFSPGGFATDVDTGDDLGGAAGRAPARAPAGRSAGRQDVTVAESPAYAFLVGSKRVRVPAQAGAAEDAPAAPRRAAAAHVPASAPLRDPYEPEVIGAVPPELPPDPGPLPQYSDALPHLSVPDIELDGGEHDGLVVRAGSLRGDAARHAGRPRKDAVRLARIGEDDEALLVVAVADGVGTADYSHVGAHYACSTVVEAVAGFHRELLGLLRATGGQECRWGGPHGQQEPADPDLRRLVNYAQEMCRRTDVLLAKLAQQAELPAEQCATSLRCLLVPVDPSIGSRLMFAVGGGAFVRLREGDWLPIELGGEEGRSAIALPGGWDQLRVAVEPSRPGDLLIACTDGVAELLPTPGVAERLAEQWGGRPPGPAEFLHQLQVRVKPYDDDRSAACVWERAESW